jgi:predicted TIM-barrel fold metal-dependent hydrolase
MDAQIAERFTIARPHGLMQSREPQRPLPAHASTDLVVSADNHMALADDIFFEAFPQRLKDKAPRIWWDEQTGIYQMGPNFQSVYPPSASEELRTIETRVGAHRLQGRLADMDAEGVAKEIVFPQVLQLYFKHPDQEVRGLIFDTYNAYMADIQRASGGRTFPVAIPRFWDRDGACESIRRIKDMGFKAILLPNLPGTGSDGEPVVYNSEAYDPVWATIQECDITVCHHIGETFFQEGINGRGARLMYDLGGDLFRLHFGRYVFGRILDKFPKLRVVFSEAGVAWAAGAIQDAEMIFDTAALMFESRPDHRPHTYWRNHFYTTFMTDIVGMRLLDIIGPDRVMWSVDYPHNEGTFGYSQDSKNEVLRAVGPDEATMILGGTAARVFDLV